MAVSRDSKIDSIIKILKREFKPSRMFLFGSRANGSHRKNSDYDFMLVVPRNKTSRINNMLRANRVLSPLDVDAEVFVYSQKEFNEWKNELSSIPETALNTGIEIDL